MSEHTVAVTFDDTETSVEAVIKVLGRSGYTVPEFKETSAVN